MSKYRCSWLLFAVFAILAAVSPASSATLDAALVQALQASAPGDKVSVLIVMEQQGLSSAERAQLRNMPPRERRVAGRNRLVQVADGTQAAVRAHLSALADVGRAEAVHPLFLANSVLARVDASEVAGLARLSGVRMVLHDPPVPVEEMIDWGPSPPDGSIGAGSMQPDDGIIWWQLHKVRAPEAWLAGYDGTGIVVAIIDTGVDYNHPDIASHIYVNPGEIPNNGIDDDGNGFVDDVRGWDFLFNDNDPMGDGPLDHGTGVAGFVAGDGTAGIATGVAPGATILPIRAVGGTWGNVIAGLQYAVLMNADVISMSASQKWRNLPKPNYALWREVCENELALGFIHVNSIGNEGTAQNTDPIPFNIAAPGNCPAPWLHPDQFLAGGSTSVVSVGAISAEDIVDDGSSRGPSNWEDIGAYFPSYPFYMPPEYRDYPWSTGLGGLIKPDILAPGHRAEGDPMNTRTIRLGGGYQDFGGTSAATPHVAGAIAIMLQADSTLTPETIAMILQTTAVDQWTPGKDTAYGSGLLDVYAALEKTLELSLWGSVTGSVRDAVTDAPLFRAGVLIGDPPLQIAANLTGRYSASLRAGPHQVVASRFGYLVDTTFVNVGGSGANQHDLWMVPRPSRHLSGVVMDVLGRPVPEARVSIRDSMRDAVVSDSSGAYVLPDVPLGIPLTIDAIRFNWNVGTASITVTADTLQTLDFSLALGVRDDFEVDQGWTRGNDTAATGRWERGAPVGTWSGSTPVQPSQDASPLGTICYLTQNCNPGAGPSFSDVDGGTTYLISPVFDGTIYSAPTLYYHRWFSNNTSGPADDVFIVDVSSDGGATWVNVETSAASQPQWVLRSVSLENHVQLTPEMRIRFVAADLLLPSVVEAAVDEVRITGATTSIAEHGPFTSVPPLSITGAMPNPFVGATYIRFEVGRTSAGSLAMAPGSSAGAAGPASDVRLSVFDIQGRRVRDLLNGPLPAGPHQISWDGRDVEGRFCASGVYLFRLQQGQERREGRVVLLR